MNNQTRSFTSKILRTKLGLATQRLQSQSSATGTGTDFVTQEQVMSEAIKILSEFYRYLSEPGFQPLNPLVDTEPSPSDFNRNFQAIGDDLETVFSELENIEGVILGNFNYMVSRLNKLSGKMKSVSSLLGDYALLSNYPTKDAIFLGDTFTNLNRVESNSPLLNGTQLEVNQVEGLLTLPIDRVAQKKIQVSKVPVINSNSNGTLGNSMEAGKAFNGDILQILDGNADTWFEYERVLSTDDSVALVLGLTINLGSPQIINFVRVNPNNFGTKTSIEILTIDTSIDGDKFISIKDDIPIAGWTVQDEENVFTLAPSTSKYAGQGLYTFTPRKAKYIHLTLRQSTPYIITTSTGTQLVRYAIGLRDVHIEAQPYKTKGELISTEYVVSDEVRKVVLLSNQSPDAASVSTLAGIKHYVSPDNGSSWYEIRPKVSVGLANTTQAVPELLDFNGIDQNTVHTSNPVFKLRYKALMERYPAAFTAGSSDLGQEFADQTELHKPPSTTPFVLALEKKPKEGSVQLYEPNYGSRGLPDVQYDIAVGTGSRLQIKLPWKPMPRSIYKYWDNVVTSYGLAESGDESLYVDGKLWSRGDPTTANGTTCYYKLDFTTGSLITGDGTAGAAPPAGSIVTMTFGEERIFPNHDSPHTASLEFPTTNDKGQVILQRIEKFLPATTILQRGSKIHQLKPNILNPFYLSISDVTVFNPATRVTYVDGESELTAGKWSVDYENGILYSYSNSNSSSDTTISYYYYPRVTLSEGDWEFGETAREVVIVDNLWKTLSPPAAEVIPGGYRLFGLENIAVVKGSLVFSNTAEFIREINFVDGRSEFLNYVQTTEQISALAGTAQQVTFSLRMPISYASNYEPVFSDTDIFETPKTTLIAVNVPGDYFVDRTANTVTVWITTSEATPGTITYYYSNPQVNTSGRYSVNYKTGQVFTSDLTTGAAGTVTYQYTDYRIKYPMAREVSRADWELDVLSNKITIKDREILSNMKQSQITSGTSREKFYRVSYKYMKSSREDVNELEPFFSPVLKDYALKIITQGRLS